MELKVGTYKTLKDIKAKNLAPARLSALEVQLKVQAGAEGILCGLDGFAEDGDGGRGFTNPFHREYEDCCRWVNRFSGN